MNSIKKQHYKLYPPSEQVQVIIAAIVWISLTTILLVHGYRKEKLQSSALRPPTIPEAVSVSQDKIPRPGVRSVFDKK